MWCNLNTTVTQVTTFIGIIWPARRLGCDFYRCLVAVALTVPAVECTYDLLPKLLKYEYYLRKRHRFELTADCMYMRTRTELRCTRYIWLKFLSRIPVAEYKNSLYDASPNMATIPLLWRCWIRSATPPRVHRYMGAVISRKLQHWLRWGLWRLNCVQCVAGNKRTKQINSSVHLYLRSEKYCEMCSI